MSEAADKVERGEPVIRSAPMPSDMNSNGDIFGGWVLSQMDIAGGIVAARRSQGRTVTVAVDAMTFHQPIKVGDVVSIYARVIRVGRSSMAVRMETIVVRRLDPGEIKVTEGTFTYVAIDENGRPRPVPPEAQVS
ncbi:acyl-CoA thioesterase [Ferrovibrio sp.]|uniref:acyl-CoA thioesterase n=1 Tax=Ferrovibrio sp. TaxID=1917215 RepID=UPI0025B7EA49|nr:acyl-CoA thioesterase [Ferrovibrio sp.]MBX3454983.1 acyl-CoA thioesterase [Ferrovibrio sp.]